jgi:hypothetical protein
MCATELETTRNNQLFCSYLTKKLFSHILIIRGMTFEFEYLDECEFILKNNQECQSGDQEGAFLIQKN